MTDNLLSKYWLASNLLKKDQLWIFPVKLSCHTLSDVFALSNIYNENIFGKHLPHMLNNPF